MGVPFSRKVLFGLGQFGLVLSGYGILKLFSGFFASRGFNGTVEFPPFIVRRDLFGYFTAAGFIMAAGRIADMVAGFVSGWASDRNKMATGTRSRFLFASFLPVPLFSALVFFPPFTGNTALNTIYVLLCTLFFFLFLSLYGIPYLALMAEIGKTMRDRLQLAVILALATALGMFSGNRILFLSDRFHTLAGFDSLASFRLVIVLFSIGGALCLFFPAYFLSRKADAGDAPEGAEHTKPPRLSFRESIGSVVSDKHFAPWLFSDFLYRIASGITVTGFLYFITVLLGLSTKKADYFLLVVFFLNVILYFPVYALSLKIGKRRMLILAFIILSLNLLMAIPAGLYPIEPTTQAFILSVMFSLSLSVFTVIPYAVIGDLSAAHTKKTGVNRGGLYFGVHAFVSRSAQMVTIIVFPLLLGVGAASVSEGGLRIAIAIAALSSLVGLAVLHEYREKEVTVLLD